MCSLFHGRGLLSKSLTFSSAGNCIFSLLLASPGPCWFPQDRWRTSGGCWESRANTVTRHPNQKTQWDSAPAVLKHSEHKAPLSAGRWEPSLFLETNLHSGAGAWEGHKGHKFRGQIWTKSPGRSAGAGNSNPLQYSCLENPMDREAWRATVHGVTKSRT